MAAGCRRLGKAHAGSGLGKETATPMSSALACRDGAGLLREILPGATCAQRARTFQGHIKPEKGVDRLPAQPKIGKVSKLPVNNLRVSR